MITTTWQCDRCGTQTTNQSLSDLWRKEPITMCSLLCVDCYARLSEMVRRFVTLADVLAPSATGEKK